MKKIIAAINMTLDGYCDHTAVVASEEMHDHYTDLIKNADTLLYGRITYQLMEYWRTIIKEPTDNKAMNDFAVAIDHVHKIVFSHTLKNVDWETAELASKSLEDTVKELRQKPGKEGKDIFVCSPGLIVQLTKLNLIDEYQLLIHPVIVGSGLPLFKNITEKITLKLVKTHSFNFGAVLHYYEATDTENNSRP